MSPEAPSAGSTTEALAQLQRAGYLAWLTVTEDTGSSVRGVFALEALDRLAMDARFAHGVLYRLHMDVGHHLIDYRSYRGAFGSGSLQIVVDQRSGRCYADVDAWNPYADVVGFVGHAVREVLPRWMRTVFRRA